MLTIILFWKKNLLFRGLYAQSEFNKLPRSTSQKITLSNKPIACNIISFQELITRKGLDMAYKMDLSSKQHFRKELC